MKKLLPNLILLLLLSSNQSFCQGPRVYLINPGYIQFKYGCITQESTYDIEYPAYKVTNLVYDELYEFETHNSTIFDYTNYEPWPTFQAYGSHWRWNHQTITIDTIFLHFGGAYSNLNLGASEWLRFGISTIPYQFGQIMDIPISTVSDMTISGSDLFCSTPVTFYLLNMPTSFTSATWQIKQGTIVKASGSGTSASTNNLSNGPGNISFTVHFVCGLKDLTFTKDFWLGTPLLNVTGPSSGCTNNTYNFSTTIDSHANASNYTWELIPLNGNYLSPYGYQNNSCAITFYNPWSASGYTVGARAQNSCGTGGYGTTNIYIHNCYSFSLSPNPASETVTVTKKVSGAPDGGTNAAISEDAITIYTIRIIDYYGALHYSATRSGDSFTFPVSGLNNGQYIVQITDGKNSTSLTLIVKH